MDNVTIEIKTETDLRATEIIADLRAVAETLYYPMQVVGFWDYQLDIHLCPQEERRQDCPHKLPESDPAFEDYALAIQRGRQANLEVKFSHASLTLYLS